MKNRYFITIFLSIILGIYATNAWSAKIVRPWRSTTAIVKAGESFEVWFDANDGQTVESIQLESPYLIQSTSFTFETGDWKYDSLSGNRYNTHIEVIVPDTTPADRYNLVLKTNSGDVISHGGVKVVNEFKSNYYIMHFSDGHLYQNGYDVNTMLLKKTAMIDIANIMDCQIIVETGDNMYNVRNHPEREVMYFQGNDEEGKKGMADASAATFLVPGDHDAYKSNDWPQATVQVNSDFFNDYWGLQNSSFKYGNGRFMMLNNAWSVSTSSGGAHQYQADDAIAWLKDEGAGGNFFATAGHCYNKLHEFIDNYEPLDLVMAGDKHHIGTDNPYEFEPGRQDVAYIARSIREHFEFNLYMVNDTAGTMETVSGTNSLVEVLASGDMNSPSTWEPKLTLSYDDENDGSFAENTATLVNQFDFPIHGAKVRFVLLKGYNYIFDNGILLQQFDGDDHHVVDITIDLPENSTTNIYVRADDFCPDDPNKTEPGLCGCGVPEGTCPSFPLVVNDGSGDGSYQPLEVATITADTAPEGMYFESWTIKAGTPIIDDTLEVTTTLTLGYDSAVVEPVYLEIPKVNNAVYVSQEIPLLIPGDDVVVKITMKNTGNTPWSKEGGFYLGSQRPADNTIWGLNRVSLDEGEVIEPNQEKTFSFNIQVPLEQGTYIFQWQMIEENVEWFGNKSSSKILRIGAEGIYLDDCDATTGWNSSTTLILNNENNPQGNNCLQFTGNGTDEFKKAFSKPFYSGGNHDSLRLQFWYYISNNEKSSVDQVELGSSGKPDENEYNWSLSNLSVGWNFVSLKIKDATVMGSPDLNAVNWFRLYNHKNQNVTTRIDAIEIIDPYAGERYSLTVNNGQGSGHFYSGAEITIKVHYPPTGQVFDKWEIVSGSPTIENASLKETKLTTSGSDAVVNATFKTDPTISLEEDIFNKTINIYPNPTQKELFIDFTLEKKAEISIRLLDISGKTIEVLLNEEKIQQGKQQIKIVPEVPGKGTFLLEIKINGTIYMNPVILK